MHSSTSNSEGAPRASRVPWGVAFGLVFFLLGESALWRHGPLLETVARYTPATPDGDPLRTSAALRRLSDPATGAARVVFLGSSQVREGVDCPTVEATWAAAVGGGSPLDMLAVVEALGSRGPRTTVLGIFPKIMYKPPKTGFMTLSTLSRLTESGAWAHMTGEEGLDLVRGVLQSVSPTLRFKDGLELAWRATAGDWKRAWREELPPQPGRVMAGYAPCPASYFERHLGVVDEEEFARASAFGGVQESALLHLAQTELARGNRVVVVDFPTRSGYSTTVPPPTLRHYGAVCERLRRKSGIVFVDQGQLGSLAETDFLDFTHLNEEGRVKVSARLAALIRDLE